MCVEGERVDRRVLEGKHKGFLCCCSLLPPYHWPQGRLIGPLAK